MIASSRVKRLQKKISKKQQAQEQVSKKALAYCRVSTDEQAQSGYGMDSQENALRHFAESQGYELIDVIKDAGVSGSTQPSTREGFKRIIELAEEGVFSILLVWKFDRLARNLGYAVTTANTLREDYGVVLRSVTEPIDTASPMGQTIFAILAGMASQERHAITERTLAGKKEKASRGGFAGGASPLGYRRDREGGLQVEPAEAEVVRRIYAMREKMTLQEIADALNLGEVPTKRGGKWYPATVRYVLDNPKYKGFVEYYFRWEGEREIRQEGNHAAILINEVAATSA